MKEIKIFIYANCQGEGVLHFLQPALRDAVNAKYVYVPIHQILPQNNQESQGNDRLSLIRKHAENANVFIYQPISSKHEGYSTDQEVSNSIVNCLRSDCLRISMPYVYNDALWPFIGRPEDGYAIINHEPLTELVRGGMSWSEVLSLYDDGKINFRFKERYEKTTAELQKRESACDVKISEFLKINIQSKRLFLTENHLTTPVFVELTRQIIAILSQYIDRNLLSIDVHSLFSRIDQDAVRQLGYYPIDKYSLEHYKFQWAVAPDSMGRTFYRKVIELLGEQGFAM